MNNVKNINGINGRYDLSFCCILLKDICWYYNRKFKRLTKSREDKHEFHSSR